jgi:GAF domain-containing protein
MVLEPPSPHGDLTEKRLQNLLAANRAIVAELSLPDLLRRIVTSAQAIGDARYAALAVTGDDGLVEQFVHCGMDEETVAAIGPPPKGLGLIGAVVQEAQMIRVPASADDPRSSGVPMHHPPITSFLGAPLRSASSVYGNLYLANHVGGDGFSSEDEELLRALAATAGLAIENARLYEQAARRQQWLRASAEISQRLLQSDDADDVLDLIADTVLALAPADTVSLVVPALEDPELLQVAAAAGRGAEQLRGMRYRAEHSLAWRVMRGEHGLMVESVDQRPDIIVHVSVVVPVSQVMAISLEGDGPPLGALVVARTQPTPFTRADLEMTQTFAEQATLALERTEARGDRYRLEMLEDRARIARDLHDHVVQRLFAAGLTVQAASATVANPALRRQMVEVITDLDATIRRIRSFIFELTDIDSRTKSVRLSVMAAVADVAPLLGFTPSVAFQGPLDTLVGDDVAIEATELVRERLTELAGRGGASSVQVELAGTSAELSVTVDDDAEGPASWSDSSAGRRSRAARPAAEVSLEPSPLGGSRLRWRVPLAL